MKAALRFVPLAVAAALMATSQLTAFAAQPAVSPTYSTKDIGPSGQSNGVFINDNGHVAGTSPNRKTIWVDNSGHQRIFSSEPAKSTENIVYGFNFDGVILIRCTFHNGRNHRLYVLLFQSQPKHWQELPIPKGYDSTQDGALSASSNNVVGTILRNGSKLGKPALWTTKSGKFGEPILLPLHKGESEGFASAVDWQGGSVYIAGLAGTPGHLHPVDWVRRAGKTWRLALKNPSGYRQVMPTDLAIAPSGAMYISANLVAGSESVTAAAVWTVHCTHAVCKSPSVRILATFGAATAVNAHGAVVGWTRPNGDPGPNMQWNANGTSWSIPILPYAINNQGEISGAGPNAKEQWHAFTATPTE